MAEACLGRGSLPNTPEQILLVQSLLDLAFQAAATGRTVPLP
jgi:predicted dehydrogenase